MAVVLLLLVAVASVSAHYQVCVLPRTPSYRSATELCDKLAPTPVRCVIADDRLQCMRMVAAGQADLAVLDAEDLLAANEGGASPSDLLVTHRLHTGQTRAWEFGVVAVVSNKANISSLVALKGKRLCHPGFDPSGSNYDWNELFSLYFEGRVTPPQCDSGRSVEENRVKSLADFFGDSCKPGLWAADPDLDVQLKSKYKSMCALCDVPSLCSQRDKYWGRQGALYCLSDCLGDVAWSILRDAKLHFNSVGVSVCGDVSLLCPDGSLTPLNSTEPCLWVTRPVPVIAAKRTRAEEVQRMVRQALQMPDRPDDLIHLFESSPFDPPEEISPSLTPHDYLATAPGFLSASFPAGCQVDRAVRLCVSSLQDKAKCDTLSAAARVYGQRPVLGCVYGADCLASVANGSADAAVIPTDLLMAARRDYNLNPLLVQVPIQLKKAKTVSAVVKSNSKITKLTDLKGKKACFPAVDGMGWTSFISHMQKSNSLLNDCPYPKVVSEFFSEICISEQNPVISGHSNIKICSSEYDSFEKEQTHENLAFNNEAIAFECLAVGGGDVAFISTDFIPKYLEDMRNNPQAEDLSVDSFRVLCEGVSPSPALSHDCALSWASSSQVVVPSLMPSSHVEDVTSLFTGLNSLFGHYNTPSSRSFNMFAPQNTLFDAATTSTTDVKQRLEQFEDFITKAKLRLNNYETMMKPVKKCEKSGAEQSTYSLILFLCCVLVLSF